LHELFPSAHIPSPRSHPRDSPRYVEATSNRLRVLGALARCAASIKQFRRLPRLCRALARQRLPRCLRVIRTFRFRSSRLVAFRWICLRVLATHRTQCFVHYVGRHAWFPFGPLAVPSRGPACDGRPCCRVNRAERRMGFWSSDLGRANGRWWVWFVGEVHEDFRHCICSGYCWGGRTVTFSNVAKTIFHHRGTGQRARPAFCLLQTCRLSPALAVKLSRSLRSIESPDSVLEKTL
jgi:hypothetical protein